MPKIRHVPILVAGYLLVAAEASLASDRVAGDEVFHQSPNGIAERCVRISPAPGGVYSKDDLKKETEYCEIDFYADNVAMCPKTWSTSPGTMIYDITGGPYAGDRLEFERNACKEGKSAKDLAKSDLAKFKPTMNARGTSGTFSPSPLLYYHFSRLFDTTVKVPVSVWRSIDAQAHLSEVARSGLSLSGHRNSGRMNHAGWQVLVDAERNPENYSPTDDLFTTDRKRIYGVITSSPAPNASTNRAYLSVLFDSLPVAGSSPAIVGVVGSATSMTCRPPSNWRPASATKAPTSWFFTTSPPARKDAAWTWTGSGASPKPSTFPSAWPAVSAAWKRPDGCWPRVRTRYPSTPRRWKTRG